MSSHRLVRGLVAPALLALTLLPSVSHAEPVCEEADIWFGSLDKAVVDYEVQPTHSLVCIQSYNGGKKLQFSFTVPNKEGASRHVSPVFVSSNGGAYNLDSGTKFWVERLNARPAVTAFCAADAASVERAAICAVIGMNEFRKAQAAKEEKLVPDPAPKAAPQIKAAKDLQDL